MNNSIDLFRKLGGSTAGKYVANIENRNKWFFIIIILFFMLKAWLNWSQFQANVPTWKLRENAWYKYLLEFAIETRIKYWN